MSSFLANQFSHSCAVLSSHEARSCGADIFPFQSAHEITNSCTHEITNDPSIFHDELIVTEYPLRSKVSQIASVDHVSVATHVKISSLIGSRIGATNLPVNVCS